MAEHKKHKRRIPRSIFWKLFFMLISTALLIMVLVLIFFRSMFSSEQQDISLRNAESYARYIINDIGTPPDTVKALKIAEKNNLIIHYESADMVWSSKKDLEIVEKKWFNRYKDRAGWYKMHYILNIPVDNGRYLFGIDFKSVPGNHTFMISLLIFFIAVILTGLYLAIRHVLKPLQWLNEGVKKVSEGHFDQKVRIRQMDQLGRLTQSFNEMTQKIKEMINARNQLLLDVSHEMRSPLTRLKVAMEFIEESDSKKSISDDISELEYMLTEILETERMNSPHQQWQPIKTDMVKLIKEIAGKYASARPAVVIKNLPETGYVNGDEERLKICLRNVIENGLKYTTDNEAAVEISAKSADEMFIITIKDYGQGIPEQDLPYIFEPFYRVDKSRSKRTGGYGLGMSLCTKIIDRHQGKIQINSKVNQGTTVEIHLPVFQ